MTAALWRIFPNRALLGLSLILVLACGARDPSSRAATDDAIASDSAVTSPPTLAELADATFSGVADEPVTLTAGRWEGEPFVADGAARPAAGLVRDFLLTGDLDGDGDDESAVLLWTSSGGSGTFDYLAVADRVAGTLVNPGTAPLGDRVKVRAGRVEDGKIVLDVVQAGPEDAACCPGEMATRVFELGEAGLTESASEVTGRMSLAVLTGAEWSLSHLAWEESVSPETRITLVVADGQITGNAGCNDYFASLQEGEVAGEVSIGQIGSTRKMCQETIMAIESRFLAQLSGVSQYGFLAGKLALSWQGNEGGGVMLFAAAAPPIP